MQKIKQEPDTEQVQQWMNLFIFAGSNGDGNIAYHAEGNTVSDTVGEGHHNAGQNRWIQCSFFFPVQSADFTEHLYTSNNKDWSSYGWYRGYGLSQGEDKYQ